MLTHAVLVTAVFQYTSSLTGFVVHDMHTIAAAAYLNQPQQEHDFSVIQTHAHMLWSLMYVGCRGFLHTYLTAC